MTKIATTPNDMTTQVGYLKELQNYLVHLRLELEDKMFEHDEDFVQECDVVWKYLTSQIDDLQTDINDLS